jgi:CelD/BcsL family acetyltransferase involved in cellulose biosynthesis
MIHLSILRTVEEFSHLATEWNDLLDSSASHVPFLRHEYLLSWWQNLGGGEWSGGELNLVIARNQTGRLVGIAPLFYSTNADCEPALLLLGSLEISDYLDFIVLPQEIPAFFQALLPYLAGNEFPAWRVMDCYNLLEDSSSLPALQVAAAANNWQYQQERTYHSPYIPLPADWETYLEGLDKKQRHEIRRKVRRLESQDLPIRWYFANDPQNLDREIDDLFVLMAQDEEKDRFLTGAMRTQLRSICWAAFRSSWLQLAFIEVDGQKAAAYLNFDFGNHIWVYNSGLNFALSALSPGWVLLSYLLRWANENKRLTFDFLRGNEEYKYRFGAIDRYLVRATIRR